MTPHLLKYNAPFKSYSKNKILVENENVCPLFVGLLYPAFFGPIQIEPQIYHNESCTNRKVLPKLKGLYTKTSVISIGLEEKRDKV